MNIAVLEDYIRWSHRGYVARLTCRWHAKLDLIPRFEGTELVLSCGLCNYQKLIGYGEYCKLQKKIQMAEAIFNRE